MIYKNEMLSRIIECGIVAVVRGDKPETAFNTACACVDGGVNAVEITFTVPEAGDVIRDCVRKYGEAALIGAGSVLDSETARFAILNGAGYIVGPVFSEEIAKLCNRYRVLYIPGCQTVNEMIAALESGAELIKVFPSNVLGIDFIKSVKFGPLPQALLMPSGGVTYENIGDWMNAGASCVSAGSDLTKGAQTGDYEKVKSDAARYIKRFKQLTSAR